MKSLKDLCVPRASVFDKSRRDVVLDITDLPENKIDPDDFFAENYLTDGMKRLLENAFSRFERKSPQGLFRLTQAMGGGKTHTMLVLGLLANNPKFRAKIMGDLYRAKDLGPVRVVAFSGRQNPAEGLWGEIAEQLGKKEVFKELYSPLRAPGQQSWIKLLKGEPLLILLDELPPYLENGFSVSIGASNLAQVTTTALANLFVAVGKEDLSNVCVVISDLRANYTQGTRLINEALGNLEDEINRSALNLEPVGMNTDEIYHVLRKRLFESQPSKDDVREVAQAYARAVKDAKQMDITSASPDKFGQLIQESYPFHPSIRDLYARFRENPGFQQTRGLIRLMRILVSRLYDPKDLIAASKLLIAAHDLDLNDRDTLAEISLINPTLDNAIAHDIASTGTAVAEQMDAQRGGSDTRDASKLLLISSLANVPNAILGLSPSEVVSYLCEPGRDVSKIPQDVLGLLSTRAWYLHSNRENRLFFKNTQNLVAKLRSTAESYNEESSLRELRTRLETIFAPTQKDVYQAISVLPAVDEIEIRPDKVTLILYRPYGGGLHPNLQKLYDDQIYKNRMLFLSGQKQGLTVLIEAAKEIKAVTAILAEMHSDGIPANDVQRIAATELFDKIQNRLLSAARETFTTLTFPSPTGNLATADFQMQFQNNQYRGEQQIRETLKAKRKFTEDVASDAFRRMCEERLFTQKSMPWTEVKKRAATEPRWPWHNPEALDVLKEDMVAKGFWREEFGHVEKPPFPRPDTSVRIQEISRDEDTGAAQLKITPIHGDKLYFEIGALATAASQIVENAKQFLTAELEVSFLCVDSKGEHNTGDPVSWRNRITLKHRTWQDGEKKMAELRAAPGAPIRYTTDGSNPKTSGGLYNGPFEIPRNAPMILAVAEKEGTESEVLQLPITWDLFYEVKIDPASPVAWTRKHKCDTTQAAFELIERVKKYKAQAVVPRLVVAGDDRKWIELTMDERFSLDAQQLETTITQLRSLLPPGQVALEADQIIFGRGQDLLDWVADAKLELQPAETSQP
jgi:hypothetical protein